MVSSNAGLRRNRENVRCLSVPQQAFLLQHRDRKHQFRMRSLNLIELAKQGLAVAKLTKVFPELLPHKRKSVPSFMNNY